MITEEDEYFLRASILLVKGGRLVSKGILYKELRNAGGNLDVLLKQHERKLKHKFVKQQREKLFPAAGVTDVETWDLAMLTTVSLTVFKQSLNDDEKNGLKSIRCMRDEIYACSYSSSLSADQYEKIRKELRNALTSLSNGLSEKLKDDCFKIIQECTTGTISPSLKAEFTKQIEDSEQSLQAVMNKLRNQDELLSEMKKDIMDKLQKISVTEDRSEKIIKVIDNELALSGAANESKDIDFVEGIITTVINKAIKKVGNENDYPRIRSVVDKILKDIENMPDVEILPAEHKSILHPTYIEAKTMETTKYERTIQMPIKVESVQGIKHIWSLFETGEANYRLNELSDAVFHELHTKITVIPSVNVEQVQAAIKEAEVSQAAVEDNASSPQTQQSKSVDEERISQRVVEQLLQNTQFRNMIQTREVSMTRADTADEHMESTPRSHRCSRCNCKTKCSCSCHLLKDSDLKTPSDFKNDTHDVYDCDHETPNSDQRNEYGRNMSCVKEQESNDELHEVYGACGGDPGGPPSDDSSSDDNSDDGRKNKDYRSAYNKGNKKKTWVIDAAAWQICLEADDNFENQAANLLEHRKLPNQGILNAACAKYTLSSPVLKDLCKCICRYIKEKSENIVYVWAAYTYRKDSMVFGNEIVFVVLTTHTDIIGEKDFSIYQRRVLDVKTKTENMKINEKELDTSNRPSATEIQDLEVCLRENAKTLMKEHSELTRVTAGWYRACVNDTGQYSLQKQLCIVLYVHVKGYVPLEEKPFPTQIGKYPVDVREGIFTLCRGPNDYHENLKMGCAVRGESQGTLGAFIEFENDVDLYSITCAHVVFGNEKLKWIIEHGQVNYPNSETGETVYQPASQTFIAPFGKTVMALYDEGGNGGPGMEIALIKIIQNRWPTEGTFPDDSSYRQKGFGLDNPFTFCSGKVWKPNSRFHSPIVYKYGGESRLTSGIFRVEGASVRTRTFKDNVLGAEMIMHDQIEIHSLDGSTFATKGDSGALIFANEQNDSELSAVGLFEGKFEGENIYTVTPMFAVLNKLRRLFSKQCTLKKFAPFHCRFEDPPLGVDLYRKVSSLNENVTVLSEKLERIEQGLAQDLAQHKKEITEGLQKQSEEQKRQTLELKDQQKRQSEEHKKQTQEIKDQQKRQSEEQKRQTLELKDQQKRQSEEHRKQTQELKDQQKRQSEQTQEIKDQTTQILNLLQRQNAS